MGDERQQKVPTEEGEHLAKGKGGGFCEDVQAWGGGVGKEKTCEEKQMYKLLYNGFPFSSTHPFVLYPLYCNQWVMMVEMGVGEVGPRE